MTTRRNIPLLPGYQIETKPRNNFSKKSFFDTRNGVSMDTTSGDGPAPRSQSDLERDVQFPAPGRTTMQASSAVPAWLAFDRKVLRFYAYFKEAVFSSAVENYRVRKCVLYYYLEDDSVHIAEPKVENSGIPQGVFIKRHRVPKSDNSFISVNDLFIGNELNIYGRVFKLYDCDDFSKQFFTEMGMALDEPIELPLDPYTKKQTSETITHNKLMNPMKQFMEATLGKQMGVDIIGTQKFLKNDRKVLRFYCMFNDQQILGEKRPYILHYFLADDTVEIIEVRENNNGRDPVPKMLRRSKLPKAFNEIALDVSRIGTNVSKRVQFYTDQDLRVGEVINVYGREFLICAADEATQRFYIENYGYSQDMFTEVDFSEPPAPKPQMHPPAYNGFGTEEDSLSSFLYLTPKVPKNDFKKFMENDGLLMRFTARLVNPQPEDRNRRFIFTYYTNTDEIAVFEKFERNSGFVGGKFQERRKVKNPETGQYYNAADLATGEVLMLNSFRFELMEPDDFTQEYMNRNPHLFPKGAQGQPDYEY